MRLLLRKQPDFLFVDLLRSARRIALSSYVANGAVAALGLLLITVVVHLFLGPEAGAAATVGAIVATPPDQPAPRRGKFTQFLPAVRRIRFSMDAIACRRWQIRCCRSPR
jgi:hypothetical protein